MTSLQPDEIQRLHQGNRAAWNEAAARYEGEIERDIAFLAAGGKAFQRPEWPFLHDLAAWCRRAIHLQCAGGLDTLSLWNQGAAEVVGIDISERMLKRARQRAAELGNSVELHQMDAQRLDFPDDSFEAAVSTFVYCSVPDAVRGLRELGRVVKPAGKIFLLEHVRINEPELVGKVMDLLDPVAVRLMGPHINRRTVENVLRAGLEVERVESLAAVDLVKFIVARPVQPPAVNGSQQQHPD